jgi:hypothetical protein
MLDGKDSTRLVRISSNILFFIKRERGEVARYRTVQMDTKQCCGSRMLIPDPNFSHPGSRIQSLFLKKIPDSRIRIQEFKYFNPKNCFYALANMIWDVHPRY